MIRDNQGCGVQVMRAPIAAVVASFMTADLALPSTEDVDAKMHVM
jgi:hypothetical protein